MTAETPKKIRVHKECGTEVTYSHKDDLPIDNKFFNCAACGKKIRESQTKLVAPGEEKSELDILNEELEAEAVEEKKKGPKKKVCGDCRFFRKVEFCPKVVGYSPQQKSGDGEYRIIDLLCMPYESACKVFQPKKKRANSTGPDMGETLTLLNKQFIFKCPTDTIELFGYNAGHYGPFEYRVHEVLEARYDEELNSHFVQETVKHLQRANYVEREEINKLTNIIPIKNGLFNLLNRDLEKFTPDKIFTYKLNVEYDPSAKSPLWLKFVNKILLPEDIPLLQEIMGYCLVPDMPLHKIFWWYGRGRGGKGVVIRTLNAVFGKNNVSNLNLSEFSEGRRFSLCQLYGKFINVSSEPKLSKYGLQTNIMKMIVGQDPIDAELKGKNKRLKFINHAKPIVLGNRFPKVEDDSLGWWDRCETLNFPRSYTGKDVVPNIEKAWVDNPTEVSGIFNWMLEGLYRLKENNVFTKSKSAEETKIEFMRVSDPFRAWLNDCCIFITVGKVTRDDAYSSYKDYSGELGATPDTERSFYAKMRNTPRISKYRTTSKGKTERGFQGLTIKTEEERENNISQTKIVSKVSGVSSSHIRESSENNKKGINKEVWKPDISDIPDINPKVELEKLEKIRNWILTNKDVDGDISKFKLKEKISEYGLNVTEVEKQFKKEGLISESDTIGAWRVHKKKPKKYTKDNKGLTLGEFEQRLRASWKKGTTTEFYELIHQNSDLDRKETSELVRKWLEDGIIVYDPEKLLVWVKGSTKSLSSFIEAKKKPWFCEEQFKFTAEDSDVFCRKSNKKIERPDQCTPECDLLKEAS